MAELVVLQAVALGFLALLIGGLLRSHAEILRALHRLGADVGDPSAASETGAEGAVGEQPVSLRPPPRRQAPRAAATTALDLTGTSPTGEPVEVAVHSGSGDTLLAFLSSSCTTCLEFWRALRKPPADLDLPAGTRLVVVTKGQPEEDVAEVRRLAPAAHPVVLSTEAWKAYGIPTTPYFIHVDGPSGEIVGQGSGSTWAQVAGLLKQAVGDAALVAAGAGAGGGGGGAVGRRSARQNVAEAEAEVDRKLLAAGIRPGDPSLYPSREAE